MVLLLDMESHMDPIENQTGSSLVPQLLSEIEDSITHFNGLIDKLTEQTNSGKLNSDDGISLLSVKNQMMAEYLTNVVYVIARKLQGKTIENEDAIERLVEIRTVLERIRPVEHKLKYMMDKLVKAALTGVSDDNSPAHYRANPDNMADNMDDSNSGSEEEEEKEATKGMKLDKKAGVYVPPRLAPMHYDEEENAASRRQRQLERAKRRALHSSVVQELREEYLDTPTEVSHANALRASITKHQRLKNQYEEEFFTRLPTSVKDRHKGRHSMTVGNIGNHLTHFEDIQVLEDDSALSAQRKGKRKSVGRTGKKKGFKRRKTH